MGCLLLKTEYSHYQSNIQIIAINSWKYNVHKRGLKFQSDSGLLNMAACWPQFDMLGRK